jgi:hypothetical protein
LHLFGHEYGLKVELIEFEYLEKTTKIK